MTVALKSAQNINFSYSQTFMINPLHRAVSEGNISDVEVLLTLGADVNAVDASTGESALHIAVTTSSYMAPSMRQKMVLFLLGHGASCSMVDGKGSTPLHNAVRCGEVGRPGRGLAGLLDNGADLDLIARDRALLDTFDRSGAVNALLMSEGLCVTALGSY
eukprot:GILJ01023455.1.p1 GENE.GILJ01023455.1~~GILJ01023455.1.p1  ORF type:complete len:161 (+),score=3.34 GILJ01023455.1:174-656(+)